MENIYVKLKEDQKQNEVVHHSDYLAELGSWIAWDPILNVTYSNILENLFSLSALPVTNL